MLQSIQYVGSGPATYVYSKNAVGASGEYYHVFATETRGYDSKRERNESKKSPFARLLEKKTSELEEVKALDTPKQDLAAVYLKGHGKRESFLWKQR